MRPRPLLALLSAAVLLAACGDGDETTDTPEIQAPDAPDTDTDTDVGDADVAPDAGDDEEASGAEPEAPSVDLPEIEDGVVAAEGVIVPVPEGWSLDETSFARGLVGLSPGDEPPSQLLLASGDVAADPLFGVPGLGYDEIVEVFTELIPEGPSVDEQVDLAGAERARLIRYDEVSIQEGQAPTDEILLLAEAEGGERVALFNYAAATTTFDEDVVQLLLDEAGIDPDSEPTRQPQPAPDDPDS